MSGETSVGITCPLESGHEASFDCATRTLDCPRCGYALSRHAAAALCRTADRLAVLEEVVAEHLASMDPARRLASAIAAEQEAA